MALVQIFEILIYESLTVLMTAPSSFSTLFIRELLDRSVAEEKKQETQEKLASNIFGYPYGSYLRWISINLCRIIEDQNSVRLFPFKMPGIVEIFPLENLIRTMFDLVTRIQKETEVYHTWSLSFKVVSTIISFFKQSSSDLYFPLDGNQTIFSLPKSLFSDFIDLIDTLGPRGLLYLLGVRTTLGSVDVIPPERLVFPDSFTSDFHQWIANLVLQCTTYSKWFW
jgi:hypothetical protein